MKINSKNIQKVVREELENFSRNNRYYEDMAVSAVQVKKVKNKESYDVVISLDQAEEDICHVKEALDNIVNKYQVDFRKMYICL